MVSGTVGGEGSDVSQGSGRGAHGRTIGGSLRARGERGERGGTGWTGRERGTSRSPGNSRR